MEGLSAPTPSSPWRDHTTPGKWLFRIHPWIQRQSFLSRSRSLSSIRRPNSLLVVVTEMLRTAGNEILSIQRDHSSHRRLSQHLVDEIRTANGLLQFVLPRICVPDPHQAKSPTANSTRYPCSWTALRVLAWHYTSKEDAWVET